MNPLVFLILTSDRDFEARQKEYWLPDDKVKFSKLAPQPKQKTRKQPSTCLRPQKTCECS
jgi:hypothetical protein